MRKKILIPLCAAACCGSGFAATGMSGNHADLFTTTTVHHGDAPGSQAGVGFLHLGTVNVPAPSEEKSDDGVTNSPSILIPEPASAFLGIIGLALILLRRK